MPTLRQISEITGVSISTVSRVLNNDSRISEATKKKVLRVAKKIGYSGEISNGYGSKVVMFFVTNPHKSIESDEFFREFSEEYLEDLDCPTFTVSFSQLGAEKTSMNR